MGQECIGELTSKGQMGNETIYVRYRMWFECWFAYMDANTCKVTMHMDWSHIV